MLYLLIIRRCSSGEDDDDWCPPLPARTYLMDASREELSSPSSKVDELSGAATLASSPQRDAHKASQSPRLPHFDLLARHQSGSQSNPDLFHNAKEAAEMYNSLQWAEDFKGENLSKGPLQFSSTSPVCSRTFAKKKRQRARARSVMYNLVRGLAEQRVFVHGNHALFNQPGVLRFPEDDVSLLLLFPQDKLWLTAPR